MNKREIRELINSHYNVPRFVVNLFDDNVSVVALDKALLNTNIIDKVAHAINYYTDYDRVADKLYSKYPNADRSKLVRMNVSVCYTDSMGVKHQDKFYSKKFAI